MIFTEIQIIKHCNLHLILLIILKFYIPHKQSYYNTVRGKMKACFDLCDKPHDDCDSTLFKNLLYSI